MPTQQAMRRASSLGVLLAAALLLAGCGGGGSSPSPGVSKLTVAAPVAVSGPLSSVTWDLSWGEPTSLDPVAGAGYPTAYVLQTMCDSLYNADPRTGAMKPGVATSTDRVDATTLVYHLRRGVKFWNGDALTSRDVVYSLSRQLDPTKAFATYPIFQFVKSITADGPYQVTVKFKRPDSLFPGEMTQILQGGIHQRAAVERLGKAYGTPAKGVMCSGPYRFTGWTPGNEIVATANADYWNAALRPKVDRLTFKFVSGTSAITTGLLSGALDGAVDLSAATQPALSKSSSGRFNTAPALAQWELVPAGGLLKDADVRRALSLSMNRAGIAKTIFHNTATPARSFYPPATWASYPPAARQVFEAAAAKLPGGDSDIAAAKQAVQRAGSPKGTITVGLLGGDQVQQQIGTVVQDSARQAGLNVRLRALTPTQYLSIYSGPDNRRGLDAILVYAPYQVTDSQEQVPYFVNKGQAFNFLGYDDAAVTRAVTDARATLDPVQRARLLVQAQDQFQGRDQAVIPVVNSAWLSYVNNKVGGFVPSYQNAYSFPWAALLGAAGS